MSLISQNRPDYMDHFNLQDAVLSDKMYYELDG